ncbi:pilus assembly protein [Streptomyces olivaceus]|uniref:Pilus assembly protein n=1 Tax=Streptomyces olivaceus TaxID=47716 RepID=A0ABS7VXW4_STROV|nr:pilus assembly protein [Streptomyces olivaceus]QIP72390.1 pilus assembly protein [Streptomyces sp. VN1]MBZ6094126.1 pilus assembly protein [Streptomyces olivaceus]MBZ6108625.1 pilus assembly protein [Streptomyces olivaceus]MBZ6115242.1 pilus assembly protein [Streptomyces olivaceus]
MPYSVNLWGRAWGKAPGETRGRAKVRVRAWGKARRTDRTGARRRDRGQVAIEYLGFLPVLIAVGMAVVQLGLVAYTAQQAGTAARAGARSASLQESAQGACAAAVSSWLADGTDCPPSYGGEEVTVTATVGIPSIVPGWDFGDATRTATMPLDH